MSACRDPEARRIGALRDLEKTFTGTGPFEASRAAERWCAQHGISVGSMQRGSPRGLLFGRWVIAKWRNLSAADRRALHGEMHGGREGPVRVVIFAQHRHLIPESEQCPEPS